MANDGKIYITISDKRFGQNIAEADAQNQIDKEKESKESSVKSLLKHRFFNFIESEAKQAVTYTIGNIGNFTGDYVTQQHVSDAMHVLNFVMDIGTAAGAGAASGGWVGAAVGVALTITSKGITMGQEAYASWVEGARQNRDIAQLRSRAGLNSTNNGNRGTDQ